MRAILAYETAIGAVARDRIAQPEPTSPLLIILVRLEMPAVMLSTSAGPGPRSETFSCERPKSSQRAKGLLSCLNVQHEQQQADLPFTDVQLIESMRAEIEKAEASGTKRPIEKFILAALSSIPWIGSFVSAAASFKSEEETHQQNYLQMLWVEEHQRKLIELARMLEEIRQRFESLGSEIDERIQSDTYLSLVRKTFRTWDNSDTKEKHRMLGNVVTNAAGTRACPDDVIRLFLDWIELYNEVHFAVIREIYQNPGFTRLESDKSLPDGSNPHGVSNSWMRRRTTGEYCTSAG